MNINVSTIITYHNKVLLIKHRSNDEHYPGYWGVPGGSMEEGDYSIGATATREVFEETGLSVIPREIRFNNRSGNALFIIATADLANPKDFIKKIRLSDEASAYKWVSLKGLGSIKLTPFTKERLATVLSEQSVDN